MVITSKDNEIVKFAHKLQDKKYRKEYGLFLLDGIKLAKEVIATNLPCEMVFVEESKYEEYKPIVNRLNTKIILTNSSILKYLSPTKTPQGILILAKQIKEDITKISSNFLILDNIQDPGNLGAIIRSAAATNFKQIFMLNCVDVYNEKVVRASMGNILKTKNTSLNKEKLIQLLNTNNNYSLYLADMKGTNIFSLEKEREKYVGIIIGNEGQGVSDFLKGLSLTTISIPMENEVESLNAAVSASIIMYQFK